MSKFFIINLIDRLFVNICVFLTIFSWINFYTRDLWVSFILGLVFSFACMFLLHYFSSKKKERKHLSKCRLEKIDKCFLAFRLMTNIEQHNLFKAILNQNFMKVENDIITFKQNEKTCAIIFATDFLNISENDFLNIVKQCKSLNVDEVQIICNTYEKFNTNILNNKKFTLINKEKLFTEYFEKHDISPDTDILFSGVNKIKFIYILSNFFIPHKAKSYFVCGLILIFSSIILPYNTYYIIFGSMLLIFAIICKLKKIISD